jgi:hypothetical protein
MNQEPQRSEVISHFHDEIAGLLQRPRSGVPTLGALLAEHNARHPARRFRLRAVVHAGEVTFDDNGCFGEALDVVFRLLVAEPAKKAPMVLVVSEDEHRAVVRHGYEGIDPNAFTRLVMPQGSDLVRSDWIRVVEGSQAPGGRAGDPITTQTDRLLVHSVRAGKERSVLLIVGEAIVANQRDLGADGADTGQPYTGPWASGAPAIAAYVAAL